MALATAWRSRHLTTRRWKKPSRCCSTRCTASPTTTSASSPSPCATKRAADIGTELRMTTLHETAYQRPKHDPTAKELQEDRKSTHLNSSHQCAYRMQSTT